MAVRQAKGKKAAGKPTTPRVRKARRTAYQMLQDLIDKRDQLIASHNLKVKALEEKISKLQERHAARIAVDEILNDMSQDEILEEQRNLKLRLRFLKKASRSPVSA